MNLDSATMVLGFTEGDIVRLGADEFSRLLPAFLDEITTRFPDDQ